MAITTKAKIKARFGYPDTADDLLDQLIASVQAWIETYCGRLFDSSERTFYPRVSRCSYRFRVPAFPVTAVSTLHASWDIPPVYDANSLLIEDTNFVVDEDRGWIESVGGFWPEIHKQLKLVYTGGYSIIPADLEEAAGELVTTKYEKSKARAYHLLNESRDDGSIGGIRFDDMTPHAMGVFDAYRITTEL